MTKFTRKLVLIISAIVLAAALIVGVSLVSGSPAARKALAAGSEASVGSTYYDSLGDAIDSNLSTSSSGQKTVVLESDVTLYAESVSDTVYTIPAGNYITLDLNGYSIIGSDSVTRAFDVYGTLTLTDSKATLDTDKASSLGSSSVEKSSDGRYSSTFYTVDENETYTKNVYKSGAFTGAYCLSNEGVIIVEGGGTLNMYGGMFYSNSLQYGGAVSVHGSSSSDMATFNMYGGVMAKNHAESNGGAVYANYANVNIYGGAIVGNEALNTGSAIYGSNTFNLNIGQATKNTGTAFDGAYVADNYTSNHATIYLASTGNVANIYDTAVICGNSVHNYGGAVRVQSGTLNVYGGVMAENTSDNSGAGFYLSGGSALNISGGYIVNNSSTDAAGFYTYGSVTVDITGGTISGNHATSKGGALFLYGGAVCTISGGTISNNTSEGNNPGGAGIYMYSSTLTITGGTIEGNTAKYGGGIHAYGSSNVTISGGEIKNNTATNRGGGIYVHSSSSLTITKGAISDNKGGNYGGGIFLVSGATFTMTGGTISGNTADQGAGIYSNGGNSVITGGTISGNSATNDGGGIYMAASGQMDVSGVEITDNTAGRYAGGVYAYVLSVSGTVIISGNTVVVETTDGNTVSTVSNVYLPSGKYVELAGSLNSDSYIGVTTADTAQMQITAAESGTTRYLTACPYFHLDTEYTDYYIGYKSGSFLEKLDRDGAVAAVYYTDPEDTEAYGSLGDAVTAASSSKESTSGTVKLLCDCDVDSTITVESGLYVSIDLNGCTMTWTGGTSYFIMVYGTLNLYDNTAEGGELDYTPADDEIGVAVDEKASEDDMPSTSYKTVYKIVETDEEESDEGVARYFYYTSGAITGGNGNNDIGGAVYVRSSGTFNLYGGTLCGNTAKAGGAVAVQGAINMYGGSISGNVGNGTYSYTGGGVHMTSSSSTFYMYGGVISSNTASGEGFGGGISVYAGKLTLTTLPGNGYDKAGIGPVVSCNVSEGYAGGIYSRGTIVMEAGYVTCNSSRTNGGGINENYKSGSVKMSGGYITGNSSESGYGGGVHTIAPFTMTGGYISYNKASDNTGGGVHSENTVTVSGGVISHNSASTMGGGIYSESYVDLYGDAMISYNKTTSTKSSNGGAGLYVDGTFSMSGNAVIAYNNSGYYGGGLYLNGTGTMTSGWIHGNTSGNRGGGVITKSATTFTMNGGWICHNTSGSYAGGVHVNGGYADFVMNGGCICYNVAGTTEKTGSQYGGGVYVSNNDGYMEMHGGYIFYNYANAGAGGIGVNCASSMLIDGGYVFYNAAPAEGAGIHTSTSVPITIGGTAYICENYLWDYSTYGDYRDVDVATLERSDMYFSTNGTVAINSNFKGNVYFDAKKTVNSTTTAVITSNSLTTSQFSSMLSGLNGDKYCVKQNVNGYLYLSYQHDSLNTKIVFENGELHAYEYCSSCKSIVRYAGYSSSANNVVYTQSGSKITASYTSKSSDGGSGSTASTTVSGGVVVTHSGGSITWYSNLASALRKLSSGDTVTLYYDVGGANAYGFKDTAEIHSDPVLEICVGGSVTIDLNGYTINADINVTAKEGSSGGTGAGTALTVKDSSSGGSGSIAGTVTCDSKSEMTVESSGVAYIETTDGVSGTTTKIFYDSAEEAILVAAENGGTVVLCGDASTGSITLDAGQSVTIDLNGHTLDTNIVIYADGEDGTCGGGASLTVKDSSETGTSNGTGSISGMIVVIGDSTEATTDNPYKDTLSIVAGAVGSGLEVNTDSLTNTGTQYSFGEMTDGTYGITTDHSAHKYNIAEWTLSPDGTLTFTVKCACGEYYEENGEAKVFSVDSYTVAYNEGDGTVTYKATGVTATGTVDGTETTFGPFDYECTVTPVVKIVATDESNNTTVIYLAEENVDSLSDVLNDLLGKGYGIAFTLYDDIDSLDITISGSDVTIDLNGHDIISGTITVGDGSSSTSEADASLTVKDSSVESGGDSDDAGSFGCDVDVKEDGIENHVYEVAEWELLPDGTLTLKIKCVCGEYLITDETAADDKEATATVFEFFYDSEGESGYTITDNKDGTVTYKLESVTVGATAGDESGYGTFSYECTITPVVKIVATDDDENETVIYLTEDNIDSLSDILESLKDQIVVITLWGDLEEVDITMSSGDVTIDLNGHDITSGSITVGDGQNSSGGESDASLTITDSSVTSGSTSGSAGTVGCDVYVESDGDLSAEGGTYTGNVSNADGTKTDWTKYIPETVETEYVTVYGEDGEMTVIPKSSVGNVAAVSVEMNGETTYYSSIQAAMDAVENETGDITITLMSDAEGDITVSSGQNIKIDLGSHTLTGNITVENGSLTITDSTWEESEGNTSGTVIGEISGCDITIEAGNYSSDVSKYLEAAASAGETANVLLGTTDANGDFIYTVTTQSAAESNTSIQATVTYTTGDTEITVYYESIEFAAAALKDGDTLTVEADIADYVDLGISGAGSVTIDLNGKSIVGNISVDEESYVLITDLSDGETLGFVDGSIYGDGTIMIDAGSYTEDVSAYVVDKKDENGNVITYNVLLATTTYTYTDENGETQTGSYTYILYTVTSVDEAMASAQVSVSYETDEGEVTVYYTDIADAMAALKDGDTLTLLTDINVGENGETIVSDYVLSFVNEDGSVEGNTVDFTLDLNGHTLGGGVNAGDGVNLTITDSGSNEETTGKVTGDVTVGNISTDEDDDDDENIKDVSVNPGNITIEGGTYSTDVSGYVGEGSAVYVEKTQDGEGFTYVVMDSESKEIEEAAAYVTYTDNEGNETTLYFEDLQDAVDYACGLDVVEEGLDGIIGVTVGLLADYKPNEGKTDDDDKTSLTVSGGNITIDTGDYTIDCDIVIESVTVENEEGEEETLGATLTMTGDGTVTGDVTVDENSRFTVDGDMTFEGELKADEGASVVLNDGTYSSDVSKWVGEGNAVLASTEEGEDDETETTYTVMSEEDAREEAAAQITVVVGNETVTTYYDDLQDALDALDEILKKTGESGSVTLTLWEDVKSKEDEDYTLVLDGDFTFDMNGYDVETGVEITEGSDIIFDLNGGCVDGNITVGTTDGESSEEDTKVTFKDSSADTANGDSGTGEVKGTIAVAEGSTNTTISVEGGTYDEDVSDYVTGDYGTIVGSGDSGTIIVSEDDLDACSEAYVTTVTTDAEGNVTETTTYYESVEDAIDAVLASGGTITLTDDAAISGEIIITTDVTIDLNGHTLDANIVIYADAEEETEGGKLTVTDGSDEGTGLITGTITVVGKENHTSGDEETPVSYPYADTLVMKDGVTPNENLDIDLTGLGDGSEYCYNENDDGTFGIAIADSHTHSYSIAVWTLNSDGTATLEFMCACGEYACDGDGKTLVITVSDLAIEDNDNGTYTFTASYTVLEEDNYEGVTAGTYEKTWTIDIAATVETADGETYYFETLEEAVDFAQRNDGAVIVLNDDYEGDIKVSGDVEIDLNGHAIYGDVVLDTGVYLIVTGDGYIENITAGSANVQLKGGTYSMPVDDVEKLVDYKDGYVAFVDADGYVSVMTESEAYASSAASVTGADGNTVYYESLEDAVAALEDGDTLTLLKDVDDDATILIKEDDITIDLNGKNVKGTVEVEAGASATIVGDGFVDTVIVDDGGDLEILGGTYDDKDTIENYFDSDSGSALIVNADETYKVTSADEVEESSVAYVTYTDGDGEEYDLYFDDLQTALDFAASLDGEDIEVKVTLVSDSAGSIDITSNVELDLAGSSIYGDVGVSDGVTLTITDSVGGGLVDGSVKVGQDGNLDVEGGTFTDGSVSDYIADDYVTVVGTDEKGNPTYTVMTEDEAEENSYVYIESFDEDGELTGKTYYETLENAIAAASDGDTIVMTGDLDVSDRNIEITTEVTIDTNGHNLNADITVVAGSEDGTAEGSLTIADSSEKGTGSVTGSVTVTDTSATPSSDYEDAFVMEGGVTPNKDLTIDIDIDGYTYGEAGTDDEGNTIYGVVEKTDPEEHNYNIPIWTLNPDGTVTVEVMCACGEYMTMEDDDENIVRATYEAENVKVTYGEDGTYHVTASYTTEEGVTYDCDMYGKAAATVTTPDGTVHCFDDVQEAIDYASVEGGTVTLYEDAYDLHINVKTQENVTYEYDDNGDIVTDDEGNPVVADVEYVYTDVVIDVNGHDAGIFVEADKGNSVTITDSADTKDRGNVEIGLSVDGVVIFEDVSITMVENVIEDNTDVDGEIWIRGDVTIDLNGMTIYNVDEIDGTLTLEGESGSKMKLGADIDNEDGSIIIAGDVAIDCAGNDLVTDITVTEGASLSLDLDNGTLTGDIDVEKDASLEVSDSSILKKGTVDGTITTGKDAEVAVYDGIYDPYDEDSSLVLDTGPDTIMQSATDDSGDTYYESVDKEQHTRQGHGYDGLVSCELNPATGAVTLTFKCLCGETSARVVYLTEDDYYTVVTDDEVLVYYEISGQITALNGSVYSYDATGDCSLPALVKGTDGNGYTFAVVEEAGCENTGLDTYTYGSGIVVKVVTPVTHKGLDEGTTVDGITYYYCTVCQKYVTDEHSDAGYTSVENLMEDVECQNEYNTSKDEALAALDDWYESVMEGLDFAGLGEESVQKVIDAVDEIYSELYEEISSMDYEAQTGETYGDDTRKEYLEEISELLQSALEDAQVEIEKTANQEVTRNVIEDTYNDLYNSNDGEKYSDAQKEELNDAYDSIIADLESLTVDGDTDMDGLYSDYRAKALEIINAIKAAKAYTPDDSEIYGYVESSDGVSNSVEVRITEVDAEGYTFTSDAELVYKGSEEYSDDDVLALVEGKGVVAVFDISLVDSADGTEIYVFSGTYVVRMDISETGLLEYGDLQIVYVGNDGRVEVYDTFIDGDYLVFTTTHFSEYYVLATGAPEAEKETDLMAAIIALAVVAGVLLILGIVLLIVLLMKKGKLGGKSKKTAALGIFALLAVVPAGGVAIVVVLAVLAAAFLAADIYMIYAIFTSVPVVEYVDEGTQGGGEAGNATVSDEASDDTLGQDTENETKVGDV